MSLFRRAEASDIVHIGRLLRRFYAKVGVKAYGIPYNHEDTLALAEGAIQGGLCVVGPTSCAGAFLMPFPFNRSAVIAAVAFWYFENPREIRIFQALASECKAAGATHVSAASHFPDNRIGRWYAKLGMLPAESQYLGGLNSSCNGSETR